MNIIQLQYLIDVGELGSFTEAAKKPYDRTNNKPINCTIRE